MRIVIIISCSLGTEKHKNTWTYQLIILENSSTWIFLYINHYMIVMLSVEVELNPCSPVQVDKITKKNNLRQIPRCSWNLLIQTQLLMLGAIQSKNASPACTCITWELSPHKTIDFIFVLCCHGNRYLLN